VCNRPDQASTSGGHWRGLMHWGMAVLDDSDIPLSSSAAVIAGRSQSNETSCQDRGVANEAISPLNDASLNDVCSLPKATLSNVVSLPLKPLWRMTSFCPLNVASLNVTNPRAGRCPRRSPHRRTRGRARHQRNAALGTHARLRPGRTGAHRCRHRPHRAGPG
jgi:hypothetical protein